MVPLRGPAKEASRRWAVSLSGSQESACACQQRKSLRSQQAVFRMAQFPMVRRELHRGPNQPDKVEPPGHANS